MVIEQVISRNVIKGRLGFRYFRSLFYIHEHYTQRLLQRTDKDENLDFSKLLVNAAFCLANDVREFKTDTDACHIVYKDIVLIVNFVEALNKIVFKTILLKERFTERQEDFYENAYLALDDNGTDSFVCLYPESGNMRVVNAMQHKRAVETALKFPQQFSESPF
jgi:chloramphenicol O-acetyltransferase